MKTITLGLCTTFAFCLPRAIVLASCSNSHRRLDTMTYKSPSPLNETRPCQVIGNDIPALTISTNIQSDQRQTKSQQQSSLVLSSWLCLGRKMNSFFSFASSRGYGCPLPACSIHLAKGHQVQSQHTTRASKSTDEPTASTETSLSVTYPLIGRSQCQDFMKVYPAALTLAPRHFLERLALATQVYAGPSN